MVIRHVLSRWTGRHWQQILSATSAAGNVDALMRRQMSDASLSAEPTTYAVFRVVQSSAAVRMVKTTWQGRNGDVRSVRVDDVPLGDPVGETAPRRHVLQRWIASEWRTILELAESATFIDEAIRERMRALSRGSEPEWFTVWAPDGPKWIRTVFRGANGAVQLVPQRVDSGGRATFRASVTIA